MRFNVTATKQLSATTEIYTSQIVIKLLFVVSATSINVTDVSVVLVGCITGCEILSELQRSIKARPSGQEEPGKMSAFRSPVTIPSIPRRSESIKEVIKSSRNLDMDTKSGL